jgi:amino acid transporter
MLIRLRRALLGTPLPSTGILHERLSKIQALAVFSSDALSSVAYATEEILLVLVIAGTAALDLSLPISLIIVTLLAIVASSYYQTIHGYPSGGGAYIVAYDNLGVWPGLAAAAALLIDYVLTVAVSVTAGVAAFTSAFPTLIPFRVGLCLLAVVLIAWANLRGVRESGTLFAIPTYGFVIIFVSFCTL